MSVARCGPCAGSGLGRFARILRHSPLCADHCLFRIVPICNYRFYAQLMPYPRARRPRPGPDRRDVFCAAHRADALGGRRVVRRSWPCSWHRCATWACVKREIRQTFRLQQCGRASSSASTSFARAAFRKNNEELRILKGYIPYTIYTKPRSVSHIEGERPGP